VKVISPEQAKAALHFSELIPALSEGFRSYALGKARVAPITNIDFPDVNGEIHIKPGWVADGPYVCTKLVSCYYDNPRRGLPTRDGALIMINRLNGSFEALIYDAGHITNMRTAGASAVAVQALAGSHADDLGIIGTGTQAFWHAAAIAAVRQLRSVRVAGRNPDRALEAARQISEALGLTASVTSLEQAAACSIVVTATPTREPVLVDEKLQKGALVVAMGADATGKCELSVEIMEQVDLVVADSSDQCAAVGELQWRHRWAKSPRIQQLGEILVNPDLGRRSAAEIIVFDSTGMGFQDLVAAECVLRNIGLLQSSGEESSGEEGAKPADRIE
jgi:ornithine cyclodeaminase